MPPPPPLSLFNSQALAKGEFVRQATTFRNEISADPKAEFPAEKDRYVLFSAKACPWCHRVELMLKIKGLQDVIKTIFVAPKMPIGEGGGWQFDEEHPDSLKGRKLIKEYYFAADKDYSGRFTVPIIYDTKKDKIVNNESSEILRFLNTEFNHLAKNPTVDTYPEKLRPAIDAVNAWVYPDINNGVYRSGFSRTQEAYETAVKALFAALDRAETLLGKSKFLAGDVMTEADVRLWVTLIRFDQVYYVHFKANIRMIRDYPNLWKYVRRMYNAPFDWGSTFDIESTKLHYYFSHTSINPLSIVPLGPVIKYDPVEE